MNAYNDPKIRAEKLNVLRHTELDGIAREELADFFQAICEGFERYARTLECVRTRCDEAENKVDTLKEVIRLIARDDY